MLMSGPCPGGTFRQVLISSSDFSTDCFDLRFVKMIGKVQAQSIVPHPVAIKSRQAIMIVPKTIFKKVSVIEVFNHRLINR